MKKLFYPALFHKAEEGGFWITFPDLPECMTQGDNMEDAYEVASNALALPLSAVRRIRNHSLFPLNRMPFPRNRIPSV